MTQTAPNSYAAGTQPPADKPRVDLTSVKYGTVMGHGYPDWPESLMTFPERRAYQLGVAHTRAVDAVHGEAPHHRDLLIEAVNKFFRRAGVLAEYGSFAGPECLYQLDIFGGHLQQAEGAGKAAEPKRAPGEHDVFTDADADRPDVICDGNGQVVLELCKQCGLGESELLDTPECPGERRAGREASRGG
jgi:hypothetical protein